MVHATNKETYSSINCIAIAEKASLEEIDRPSPYSAIFISITNDIREIGKHDFRSVLLHPMLSNFNLTERGEGTLRDTYLTPTCILFRTFLNMEVWGHL